MPARCGLAVCGLVGLVACARPPTPEDTVAPITEITLAPRCLAIEALPPLSADLHAREAAPLATRFFPSGGDDDRAEIWIDSDMRSPFGRVAIGVPWPRAEADDAAIAGLLLSEGWTAADPEGFRARASRLGAGVRVDVAGGVMWLSIAGPTRDPVVLTDLLDELLAFAPDASDAALASVRRRARLGRLATASLPATVARDRLDGLLGDAQATASRAPRSRRARLDVLRDRFLGGADAPPPRTPDRRLLFQGFTRDALAAVDEWTRTHATGTPPREHGPPDPPAALRPRPALAPNDLLVVDRPGAPQVEILVAIPNAPHEPGDGLRLEALASAVGGNVGGRLFSDLRERRGLVYTIDAAQDPEGLFLVTTRARAPRVPAVVAGVEAHLRALRDVPFLDCEVATLAQRMRGEDALARADADARYAAFRARLRARAEDPERALAARPVETLSADALGAVARRHLREAPIVVLVGDAAALARAFDAVAPDRRLRAIDDAGRVD